MSKLQTFVIPSEITGSENDVKIGRKIIEAWKNDGILQVARTPAEDEITRRAYQANRKYFQLPFATKKECVSDLTYSGYVAIGEEKKGGDAGDFPEVFTVFEDIPLDDARVQNGWPGHGPIPWPEADGIESIKKGLLEYKNMCSDLGHRMLQLTALGLEWEIDDITEKARKPWNYMRVLKFPVATEGNSKGIGSHTDYDLLVISSQDEDKEGLYIRPPVAGEKRYKNWLPDESMRGMYEDVGPWNLIRPTPSVFTVFPGDMMQLLTDGELLSTPHKVALADKERCSMPVFIGPDFSAVLSAKEKPGSEKFHYGSEMIQRYIEMYPDRATTRKIIDENLLSNLKAS